MSCDFHNLGGGKRNLSSNLAVLLKIMCLFFPPHCFFVCLYLIFHNLIMTYLDLVFSVFVLLENHWDFWIYRLLSFIQFWKFSANIFWNTALPLFFLFLLLLRLKLHICWKFWLFLIALMVLYPCLLFLLWFYLVILFWKVCKYSNSVFCCVQSTIKTHSPCKEFLISDVIFFISRISIGFFKCRF